jgi:hypothetical protein
VTFFNYLTLQGFLDKNILDEDVRFWIQLDEVIELNPIRDYHIELHDDSRYVHTVKLDLDTRVSALIELFKNAKYSKRINKPYLLKLFKLLRERCIENTRYDLIEVLDGIEQ